MEYIFTNGDDIAAGVRQYYLDRRLLPPNLIGQENQLSGLLLNIPTIDHHFVEIGEKALKLVISHPNDTTSIMINSEFIGINERGYGAHFNKSD